MQIKYSTETTFEPSFGGNSVLVPADRYRVRLKSMSVQDFVQLTDIVSANATNQRAAAREAMLLLENYATVENLSDLDGEVDIRRICHFPYYLPLAGEILTKLMEVSVPSGPDEKNSATQPD